MKVKKESEKAGLKLNIQKNKHHDIRSHHFMANRWGNNGNSDRLYFLGSKITADGDSVQFSHSVMSSSLRPHGLQHSQASLSITNSQSLLKLMSIESVMPSNHLVLCRTFSSCLRSFPASGSFPRSVFFTSGAQVLNLQLQHQSFQ